MKTAALPARPLHLRRAKWAVAAQVFINGALFANLLPRFPATKEALGLSNAAVLLAGALGTIAVVALNSRGLPVQRL